MFSHVLQDGTRIVVSLTPNNTVIMKITHIERVFSLDITQTAWGRTILGVPVDKMKLTEDMAAVGKFWQGVNSHYVALNAGMNYTIACPHTLGFRARAVKLTGDRQERIAMRLLSCPECGAGVTIPDHERSRFMQGQQLRVPTWKEKALAATV